jgi:tetratricopeptide (TPR) repeat protein
MKLLISLIITIALAASLLAQTPSPSPSVAEEQARQELNEAARAYREGRFAEAQARSEKALLLDPQNKIAPYFVARTIHAQYKPGDTTLDNAAKAREAIIAYQRILDRVPADDEAYKAVAYLYGALKEDEQQRQWIMQRAGNRSIANDKRSEAYVVLASREWDCSYKFTEVPGNKVTTAKGTIRYRMPKERVEFERAKECADRALELVNMAIALTPEDVSSWSYKTNILLELEKLAEMSGDVQLKRELHRQHEEALSETTKLSKPSPSKP